MRRYIINNKLRTNIIKSGYSLNRLSKICKFKIRNVCSINKSINEKHLDILAKTLKFDKEKLSLKEIKFDYARNLGKYSYSKPIRFNGISSEFAEFIGIMLGDGSITNDVLSISIDKRDTTLKNHIKNLFKKLFLLELREYEHKIKNYLRLQKCSKELVELLVNYGLKRGDKIKNKVKIPDWIKSNDFYIVSCLRGLILTDGCVYYCRRDRKIYVKFTNHCLELLNDFKNSAKKIGFSFVKANNYNTALYRKDQVARFINLTNLSIQHLGMSASLES